MAEHNKDIPSNYRYKNSPDTPILEFLQKMATLSIEIDAIVVNKAKINTGLKTLPYGVLYNYYSKNVLVDRIIKYDEARLYIDRTSKQTHKMKHFDDYLYTEALIAKGHNFPFQIEHGDSNVIAGISAVDFVAWALSRKFEQKDDSFYKVISGKIGVLKRYYFRQQKNRLRGFLCGAYLAIVIHTIYAISTPSRNYPLPITILDHRMSFVKHS